MTFEEYGEDKYEEGRADTIAESADLVASILRENGISEEDTARMKEEYLRKI